MRWLVGVFVGVVLAGGVVRAEEGVLVIGGGEKGVVPFTVGKETTVIAGPLRGDGTVDYVKAWNELRGKGVTWEENGWAGYEVAIGGWDLPDGREKMLWMAGGVMPGRAVRWEFYEDGLRRAGANEAAALAGWKAMIAAGRGVWKAEDLPELAGFLEARKEALDGVVAAAGKGRWWEPAVAGDGRTLGSVRQSFESEFELADILCARAMLREGRGDFAGFLRDVMAVKGLARVVMGEQGDGLWRGEQLEVDVERAIGAVAGEGRLTEEQCATVKGVLAGLGRGAPQREALDVRARWEALDDVQAIAVGQEKLLEEKWTDGNILRSVVVGEVNWDEVMRRVNRSVEEEMAIVGMADGAARASAEKVRAERFAREWTAEEKALPVGLRLMKKAKETRGEYTNRVGAALEQCLVEDRTDEHLLEHDELMNRMAGVMLQAAAYRAREGKWPAAMGDFLGKGEKVPVDMQGDAVLYAVTEKGVRVSGGDMDKRSVVVGVAEK